MCLTKEIYLQRTLPLIMCNWEMYFQVHKKTLNLIFYLICQIFITKMLDILKQRFNCMKCN